MLIKIKGISMDVSMDGEDSLLMLAGWWSVFHQSTENFIIGKFIEPKITSIEEIFSPTSILSKDLLIMTITM